MKEREKKKEREKNTEEAKVERAFLPPSANAAAAAVGGARLPISEDSSIIIPCPWAWDTSV